MCLPDEIAVVLVKSPHVDFPPAIFLFRHALRLGRSCE